jgi:hypothetical protein
MIPGEFFLSVFPVSSAGRSAGTRLAAGGRDTHDVDLSLARRMTSVPHIQAASATCVRASVSLIIFAAP